MPASTFENTHLIISDQLVRKRKAPAANYGRKPQEPKQWCGWEPSRSAILALLLATGYFGVTKFPLRTATQKGKTGSEQKVYRVGGGTSAPKLIKKVEPDYSEEASEAGLESAVVLAVVVGPDGPPTRSKSCGV